MKTIKDITAKVIADSISREDIRLPSLELYYPRMIHAEFMTHRKFSRNASSSRAMPVKTLLKVSMEDMYVPRFRYNKPGMQPGAYLTPQDQADAEMIWMETAATCGVGVGKLAKIGVDEMGVHKQWANRPLEWFGWITVLVSATEFMNFFALRQDVDDEGFPKAQDEIKYLADRMQDALDKSKPRLLLPGEWHLPYVRDEEKENELVRTDGDWHGLVKMSAARCARTSYLNHDKSSPTREQDLGLYDRLAGSKPIHASPMEHQATPDQIGALGGWENEDLHGNFTGWVQGRKLIDGEYVPG
jgi:thymidylate synthase ThyX